MIFGVALLLASCNNDDLQGTPSKETLEVDTKPYIEANSETYSIPVTANCQWTVEMLSGWERLQLGTRNGSGNQNIQLVTPKNDETTSREAFLLLTSQTGVIKRKIHVQQRGIDPYITLSQTLFEPTFREATYEVTVTSNAKWVITGGAAGFSCDTQDGKGNATIHFSVEENLVEAAREAVFTITSDDAAQSRPAVATVTIKQAARTIDISVAPTDQRVEADGATFPIAVSCTDKWEVTGEKDGFTCDVHGGEGDGTLNITVSGNPYETERSATFTFRTIETTATKTATFTVTQAGKQVKINVPTARITAEAIGSDYQVAVNCNAAWVVRTEATWIKLQTVEGENDGVVTFTCSPNTKTEARIAEILIMAGSQNQYVQKVTVDQRPGAAPTVLQTVVNNVTKYEATVSFSYQSNTSTVSEYGVCYATHENPTTSDSKVSKSGSDTGNDVSFTLTNLESGTTYYVRPYARNATGITYGEQKSFTTKGSVPGEDDNVDPKY